MTRWTGKKIRAAERERLEREYVPMSVACEVTGMSSKRLLTWAESNSVECYQYLNKWYVHRAELARAMKTGNESAQNQEAGTE